MASWKINSILSGWTIDIHETESYHTLINQLNLSKTSQSIHPFHLKPIYDRIAQELSVKTFSDVNSFVNNNQSSSIDHTLVIIYGQYRTFDLTCESIFTHIVTPNMPVVIVLTFDDDKIEFDEEALLCMREFIPNIYILKGTSYLRLFISTKGT